MDYVKLAATAQRLIDKTGRVVKLQRLSSEPADPDKPWKGPGQPEVAQEKELKATFVPAGGGLGRDLVDEELLKRVEQVALIAPSDVDLEVFNLVLDGGSKWKVEWIQTLKPAEQVLLYVFGVKR